MEYNPDAIMVIKSTIPVKVALDCANGSSWNIAKAVFDALGAKTYVINAQPDGTNINNNAGSTHIEGLQKYVVENGMKVGFAYDGDADRCLCVDEKGNVITGDHILYIYGKYMGMWPGKGWMPWMLPPGVCRAVVVCIR